MCDLGSGARSDEGLCAEGIPILFERMGSGLGSARQSKERARAPPGGRGTSGIMECRIDSGTVRRSPRAEPNHRCRRPLPPL